VHKRLEVQQYLVKAKAFRDTGVPYMYAGPGLFKLAGGGGGGGVRGLEIQASTISMPALACLGGQEGGGGGGGGGGGV